MEGRVILLFCFIALAVGASVKDSKKNDELTCDMIFCGLGRECVDSEGEPFCDCIQKCSYMEPPTPVCGSDDVTYQSECELHREACVMNKQIAVKTRMPCKREESVGSPSVPKPVVCLEKDRNAIRDGLISWFKEEELEIKFEKMSYKSILKQYFDIFDDDRDAHLDTMEFMKLLEVNETITESLSEDQMSNPILRGLCTDALIEITDEDSDFKLSFVEFHKSLDAEFHPPESHCMLEDVKYPDGAEVAMNCNTCKCACNHWVCTTIVCQEPADEPEV